MSQNSIGNFLIDQNFDDYNADFIEKYAFDVGIVDVLHLKDLETKIPINSNGFFWDELIGIPKSRLKMLIAWAKEEFRIREARGISMIWDGVAQVNIEEFGRQWRIAAAGARQNPFLV